MLGVHIWGHLLKRVTVVMPPDVHRQLKLLGFQEDTTMNDLILTAVHKYLSECGSKSSEAALTE